MSCPYRVFYGVMLKQENENVLIQTINEFRQRRGLLSEDGIPIELKWTKVEDEWKKSKKKGLPSRYIELLDVFFKALRSNSLSFGYMFLKESEYLRVGVDFANKQPDNKHNFFFMLYFQFLYHCFIRRQVKQQPCEIFIDNRDMGAEGAQYDIDRLRVILNSRAYRDLSPKGQPALSEELKRRIGESIQIVNLAESKQEPLIQVADICGGCIRYALETKLPPPPPIGQPFLITPDKPARDGGVTAGRDELVNYFYQSLRSLDGYKDLDLLKLSYHHRFNIFPFEFDHRSSYGKP